VVALLAARKDVQAADRAKLGDDWPTTTYMGEHLDLVFNTPTGAPVLRQHVDRAIRKAGKAADLDPSHLGTHTGRRSVVTNLHALGDFDLDDIAKFVGHSDTATTLGYIQDEGERPERFSREAFEILDP
jgi:integrase